MGKQNLQAKEVYYLSLIIDLINCDSKQALSVTTVLILNATTPVNNFFIENLPVDMKPLSAHNICESLDILGLLYFYGLSNEKSVFGFENSFSNFSPGKTHPKQLSFDAGIKTS